LVPLPAFTHSKEVHTWNEVLLLDKMEGQVARNAHAQHMFELIDGLGLPLDEKNRLKNAVGLEHHLSSITAFQQHDNGLGIKSPMSRFSSTLNTNFSIANPNQAPVTLLRHIPGFGREFAIIRDPFQSFMELEQPCRVEFMNADHLREQVRPIQPLRAQVISVITGARGFETCSLPSCPPASNVLSVYVKFFINGDMYHGACVFCRSHFKRHHGQGGVDLPIGACIYVLSEPLQQRLRQEDDDDDDDEDDSDYEEEGDDDNVMQG
jgi:hypothetical protein